MSDFKPFYVNVDGPNHSRMFQEIAFEEGYGWRSTHQEYAHFNKEYLSFNLFKDEEIGYSNGDALKERECNHLEDPTLEEFRQALRGNYNWEETIEIDGHEVEFRDKEKEIKVGCVYYTYGNIKNIYESLDTLDIVCDESLEVSISHSAVGEIPFETIEAIYNRIKD